MTNTPFNAFEQAAKALAGFAPAARSIADIRIPIMVDPDLVRRADETIGAAEEKVIARRHAVIVARCLWPYGWQPW